LVRRDGKYLIEHRASRTLVHEIVPWTEHPAISRFPAKGRDVPNDLAVEATATTVDLYVNGQKITSLPREHAVAVGLVGLKVGRGLSVHVTGVTIDRQ